MKTLISSCLFLLLPIGSIICDFKMPTGFGFNNKDPRYFIKIKRLLCDSNPKLVNITHCLMKLERNTNGRYSIGFQFARTESKMMIKVKAMVRYSANIYRDTLLQQTMDLCEFLANRNTTSLLTMVVPTLFEMMIVPDCPLKDYFTLNLSIPNLNIDPSMAATGDAKLIVNVTRVGGPFLFSLDFQVFVKGSRLSLV